MTEALTNRRRPWLLAVAAAVTFLWFMSCFVNVFIIDANGVTLRLYSGGVQYPADWSIVRQALYPRCSSAGAPPRGIWFGGWDVPFQSGLSPFLFILMPVLMALWYAGLGRTLLSRPGESRIGLLLTWQFIALFVTVTAMPVSGGSGFWFPFLFFAIVMPLLYQQLFPQRIPTADELRTCRTCGYDLFSNTSGVCPECGTPIPAEQRQWLSIAQ